MTSRLNVSNQSQRRTGRVVRSVCAVTLGVTILAACGDSAEDAFCDAGDSLRADIEGLGSVDIITNGTSALDEQFSAISSDLDDLRESGADVAAEEIDALGSATESLGTALDGLQADISVEGAQGVADAVSGVATAANAVLDKLATTCG